MKNNLNGLRKKTKRKEVAAKSRRLKYFGAKTLYLVEVVGSVKRGNGTDKRYNMYEERIVLVRASSFDDALTKAIKDAKVYENVHTNPFGQKVKTKFLNCIDVFEMFSKVEDLAEVYSITSLVRKSVKVDTVLDHNFGEELGNDKEKKIRVKFLNEKFTKITN